MQLIEAGLEHTPDGLSLTEVTALCLRMLHAMWMFASQHTAPSDLMHFPLVHTMRILFKKLCSSFEPTALQAIPSLDILSEINYNDLSQQRQLIINANRSLFCSACERKHQCAMDLLYDQGNKAWYCDYNCVRAGSQTSSK